MIIYEWDIETVIFDGEEVTDIHHDHWDKLSDGPSFDDVKSEPNSRIVLVRDEYVDEDLQDRQWCYIEDSLQFHYSGPSNPTAETVPLKFWDEYMAWREQNG